MRILFYLLGLILLLIWTASSVYTVDKAEYVYLTQFGRHVETLDGDSDGGLHWKLPWPIQAVQRLDRRLQQFDLPETELLTHDPTGKTIDKTITVVAYVCWRIAGREGVDRFIKRGPELARSNLGDQIRSRLGAEISKMKMDDLFAVEPGKIEGNLEALRQRLMNEKDGEGRLSQKDRARADYGIEIVDIRLRRTNHPQAVRGAIYERIRSERQKKAAGYVSEGDKLAQDIKSDAEKKARDIETEALFEKKKLEGEALADADRIRNQAQGKDVEFYTFLKKLEEYQRILGDNKTVLLLSSHRDLFDLLFKPPLPAKPDKGSK